MFSLQTIFGKGDMFYGLLEASAAAARQSAIALRELLTQKAIAGTSLEEFRLARQREKEISTRISQAPSRARRKSFRAWVPYPKAPRRCWPAAISPRPRRSGAGDAIAALRKKPLSNTPCRDVAASGVPSPAPPLCL